MSKERARIWLFGVPLDAVTLDEAVERVLEFADPANRGSRPKLVTTVNADFLANALPWLGQMPRHPELIRVLREADLSTADGMPVVWAARLLGARLPERVTGADLAPKLAEAAAAAGRSLYLLGGKPEAAKEAAEVLRRRHPNLRIAGVESPLVHTKGPALATAFDDDATVCEHINKAGADILLIAFGNPKQELWFARNRHRLNCGVALGIGGTFDFIAGHRTRAPKWMRDNGLEWLHRMAQEPRRLVRRYFVDLGKVGLRGVSAALQYRVGVLLAGPPAKQSRGGRRPEGSATGGPLETPFFVGERAVHVLRVTHDCLAGTPARLQRHIDSTEQPRGATVLDCAELGTLDAARAAVLLQCWRSAKAGGHPALLIRIGPALRRSLSWNRAWDVLQPYVCEAGSDAFLRLQDEWPGEQGCFALDRRHGHLNVTLFGRLEAEDLAAMDREALVALFAETNCRVDLALCSTLDSAGVGLLARIQDVCAERGHSFRLVGASKELVATIRASELERLLR